MVAFYRSTLKRYRRWADSGDVGAYAYIAVDEHLAIVGSRG